MTTTRQTVARVAVAFLTMSASGYATWQASEGFTERPMIPTAGDVPTRPVPPEQAEAPITSRAARAARAARREDVRRGSTGTGCYAPAVHRESAAPAGMDAA